jgi:membrane-associated phospholipid phosphatase
MSCIAMRLMHIPGARLWFFAAGALFAFFAIFTAIFSTGVLLYPTLYIEQWLLHRPLTSLDCVLDEWKVLGEAGGSILFTLALGIVCVLLGYRRRVLPYLFLLLLLSIAAEYVGKQAFPQVIPINVQFGLNSLACPQMVNQPRSVKIMVGLGLWWEAPPVRPGRVRNELFSATAPLIFDENAYVANGYPSGHAIRWCFIGLIACWLVWRHMKYRLLRILLMALALAIAFGGGFAQFYIGVHLPTDLIAGYLLGASLACCAIGILQLNETLPEMPVTQPEDQDAEQRTMDVSGASE